MLLLSSRGDYDEWLTNEVAALRRRGERLSQIRLISALRTATKMPLLDAKQAVEDYCRRGLLQAQIGDGRYDGWLTQQIENAYCKNQSISSTALAKRLAREDGAQFARSNSAYLPEFAQRVLATSDALDIVSEFFARNALPGLLGPYPLVGILTVTVFELLLFAPIALILEIGFLGGLLHIKLNFDASFIVTFVGSAFAITIFRNWRKLHAKKRWASYEAVREQLLARYPIPDAAV